MPGQNILRQETQIRKSDTYTDNIAAGQTDLETNSTDLEYDLNALRSQYHRVLDATLGGNWYDDIATVNSKKRSILQLNTDLDDLEEKKIICGTQVLTNITIPAAQNWKVLSVAGTEAPTDVAAVTATQTGAIVAVLGAGLIGSHQLTAVAGKNALSPKNLVAVRDAATKDAITSNGQQVYALIQAENGVVDGDTFDDTTKRVQISFVRNNGSDVLEAVPVADIQSKTIEYSYPKRITLDTFPEDCTWPPNFIDNAATVDVTLDAAIDNQVGPATQNQDIDVRITDNFSWAFQDSTGGTDILRVDALAAGDEVEVNADVDINNTNSVDISQGLQVDTTDQAINIGHTAAGQIDTAGNMIVSATGGTSNLTLSSGLETIFVDGNKSGSTYAGDLKLSETSTEWDNYETEFGEVSLLNAIVQAKQESGSKFVDYEVTAQINADTDLIPGTNATIINGATPDLSLLDFVTETIVFHNGNRQINGADATANNDVYPGSVPASGYLRFERKRLKIGDTVTVQYQQK